MGRRKTRGTGATSAVAEAPFAEAAATESGAGFCVIIPAHNEGAVIARCLRAIYRDAPAGNAPDVIVVANGCSDDTAAIARDAAPAAKVIELDRASKAGAINHANAIANTFPRLIVDADVECDFHSLKATADAVHMDGTMAASPKMRVDMARASFWVRAYYLVWQRLPYASNGLIGGGVYGLSRQAWQQIGPLPPVIADDLYVRTRFAPRQRRNIDKDHAGQPVFVTMTPPQGLGELIAIEARRRMGKHEVDILYPTAESGSINRWGDLIGCLGGGASPLAVAAFVVIKLAALVLFRIDLLRGRREWRRDLSSRAA